MAILEEGALGVAAAGVPGPSYDRQQVRAGVVHVGVGGFHRAHQAVYHDRLLGRGGLDWGICGVGVLPGDAAMRDALRAQGGLYTVVVKHPDGTLEPRVVGSIVDYLFAPDDPEAVVARLADPATRLVSLTITEGGYSIDDATGRFDPTTPEIADDLAGGDAPRTVFGLVVEALARRREAGVAPFAVLSCDNLPGNGDLARTAFGAFARLRDPGLGEWVEATVPFPNSVVDRITPPTTDADRAELRERFGIEDRWPVVCEAFTQWVIEEVAGEGLPPYGDVGAQVVADVEPYEQMKLRLLNAGHQLLGHAGRLLGHEFVHEAAQDPELRAFLVAYLDEEATPTLTGVPEEAYVGFRGPLVDRFANEAIVDPLARIAAHASDRIPKFLLPVVRARLGAGLRVDRCAAIVACWARSAAGPDEAGKPIEIADRRRDAILAAAGQDDSVAFLAGLRDVFGDLADEERFVDAFRAARSALDEQGARAALAALT